MLNTVIGQIPVVVPPCEVLLHVLLRLEALHKLNDLQVGHIDLGVFRGIVILLGVQDTLLEEVLVDFYPVLLGNQHGAGLLSLLCAEAAQQIQATGTSKQRKARTLVKGNQPSRRQIGRAHV